MILFNDLVVLANQKFQAAWATLRLGFGLSPCHWPEIFDPVDLGRREADKQLERIDPDGMGRG